MKKSIAAIAIFGWMGAGCAMMKLNTEEQRDFAFRGGVPCSVKDINPHQDKVGVGGGYDPGNPPRFSCGEEVFECSFGNVFSPVCKPVK